MNGHELMRALKLIEVEKGIDREEILSAIENSILSACKKNFGTSQNIKVNISQKTGEIKVYAQKEVTEDVYDAFLEISLEEAKEINPMYEYGDFVDIPIELKDFGRISAQAAKQFVVQKFREVERDNLYTEFLAKENTIQTGIVRIIDPRHVILSLDKIDALLPAKEQSPNDNYKMHDRIKVYVSSVKKNPKGPQIIVSRAHPNLVKKLLELEIPEIFDGTILIKSVAREPGVRTKVALYSKNKNVDAIGSCIGKDKMRLNTILKEINNESIDFVLWDKNLPNFIANAFYPSKIYAIEIIKTEQYSLAKVVVEDASFPSAKGKNFANVKLVSKLTNCKIELKSKTQINGTDFINMKNAVVFDKSNIKNNNKNYKNYNENYTDEEDAILAQLVSEDNVLDIDNLDDLDDNVLDIDMFN